MNNIQVRLAQRPTGLPDASTWDIQTTELPALNDGEVLFQNLYISLDPAMRGWITDRRSYIPPVQIGAVMRAGSVGKVIDSKHPDFPVGTYAMGTGGVQEYVVSDGKGWHPVDPNLAPLPKYLSVLGITGFTAYFGLLDVGEPKEGETVLISGAAGAVGSIVGQIAKLKGCRTVGIAGGPEKCEYIVKELGFDAAIDYKNERVKDGIKQHCPKGVDVYFDNVGGQILDDALARLNFKGRVVLCGAISQYNNTQPTPGPYNYLSLLVNRGRMEGFIVMDYAKQYGQAAREMAGWMQAGKLVSEEYIVEDITKFPEHLLRLFSGEKRGKLIVKTAGA